MSRNRTAERVKEKKGKFLFKHLACYISEIEGKNKKERKELFDSYDMRWRDYCRSTNTRGLIEMNIEAFKDMATGSQYMFKRHRLKVLFWKNHPNIFIRLYRIIKSNIVEATKPNAA